MPDNTQKILTDIWHYFWIKCDGEKWSRKNTLKLHNGLQSCYCPVQKNLPKEAELARQVSRYLWRPPLNFKMIFSKPLFTIILSQKLCQIFVKFFCVFLGNKNLQWKVKVSSLTKQVSRIWVFHNEANDHMITKICSEIFFRNFRSIRLALEKITVSFYK